MTPQEKKNKLISDFRETSKVATSDFEKIKVNQATKASMSDLIALKASTSESIATLGESLKSQLIKDTQTIKENINRVEQVTKSNMELLKITKIDGEWL